jgi:hypothetical protein
MKRVASLFSDGGLTGIRGAAPEKQDPATLRKESNIANDQAKGTAVKRARGNV